MLEQSTRTRTGQFSLNGTDRVRLSETELFGEYLYSVFVNETRFDTFLTSKWLTLKEQSDIEDGYREALDGYRSPVVACD